jgi:hypothetical protein
VCIKKKYLIRINDMSLPSGGPLDILNNWDTPHDNHRDGVSVDLDDQAETEDGTRSITKKQWAEWLELVQGEDKLSLGDESDHFHLTVR